MPLRDILAAALSGPASTVVEGPVRTIVQEVLQDHGYASPAELQAVRDELSALSRRVSELGRVVETATGKTLTLEGQVTELSAQLARTEAALVAAQAEATAATRRAEEAAARSSAQPDPAPSAPSLPTSVRLVQTPCKVEGCQHYAQGMGFCLDHLQGWQAGRLEGFVGPEGLVDVDGEAFRVGPELVGQPYVVVGRKSRRVQVDGTMVKKSRV